MGPTDPLLKLRENSHSRRGPRRQVIADSLDLDWRSLNAAITQFSPLSELTRGVDHPLSLELTYLLSYPIKLTRQIEDGLQNVGIVGTRMLCLTPGFTTYWHHLDYPEVLSVFLDGSVYRSAVEEIFDCDPSDAPLIPQFAIVDPLLEQFAIAIIGSLRKNLRAVIHRYDCAHNGSALRAKIFLPFLTNSHTVASSDWRKKVGTRYRLH